MQVITLIFILLVFLIGFFIGFICMSTLLQYISGQLVKKIKKKPKKHSAKYYKNKRKETEKLKTIHSEEIDDRSEKAGNRLGGISKKTSYLDNVSEDEEEPSRYVNEYRHRQGDAYNFAKKKKLESLANAKDW